MEALEQQWDIWKPRIQSWITGLTPTEWAIGGGAFFALLLIYIFYRRSVAARYKQMAPQLTLHAFQIAPLGRDAFFKIRNNGEQATLTTMLIKGRNDLLIKSDYAGHQIDKEKVYGILLETTSKDRIQNDFSIELMFIDQHRNVYRQVFDMRQQAALPAKLVRTP